jgi:hypothetical protein
LQQRIRDGIVALLASALKWRMPAVHVARIRAGSKQRNN